MVYTRYMPDTVAERWARWRERHPDRAAAYDAAKSSQTREWREGHPEAMAKARRREKAKRAERLANDPDYAEAERVRGRERKSRRIGRPVLPFRPAAPPPPRQLALEDILPEKEIRLVRYAGRDRERERLRAETRARAQGVPPKAESTRDWIRRVKGSTPCLDCGVIYPFYVMQFDHRPDEPKLFELSRMNKRSRQDVEDEIAKCDLVCANCHSIRTYERVIRRPRVERIKVCARCREAYVGSYSVHSTGREHIATLRTVRVA